MKTNIHILAGVVTILLLASIFGFAAAQSERPAQTDQINADLGTGFTYQGTLELDGQPINGSCDFRFSLWDAAEGGNQRGTTQDVLALLVTKGRFTANLTSAGLNGYGEFDSVFDGAAIWVEIGVRCPAGSGDYNTLSPRQSLVAAPYAASLRPGADIIGSQNSTVLSVSNSYVPLDNFSLSIGIWGEGVTEGIFGYSSSDGGIGVSGLSIDGTGTEGTGNMGVAGYGGIYGVYGYGPASVSIGVFGDTLIGTGVAGGSESGAGGYFQSGAPCCNGAAVKAWNTSSGIGVWASSGTNAAIYGQGGSGVVGEATFNGGSGVMGRLGPSVTSGWAGQFLGNVDVTGTINGAASLTQIDHPLDPANRFLNQSAVVSPEMLVMVNGNAVTGEDGFAVIHLPEWFTALAGDFRYQLTPVGQFAQAIVASKVQDGQFTIQTDKAKVEVSWQVSGVRMDAYAQQHPLVVEQTKPEDLLGKYLHPELYSAGADLAIGYDFRLMQVGSPAMPHILEGGPQ